MKKNEKLLIDLNLYRLIPGYLLFKHNKFKGKLKMDLDAWMRRQNIKNSNLIPFCYFTMMAHEFRTVVLNGYYLESCLSHSKAYISTCPLKKSGGFTSNMDLQLL